MVSLVFLCSCGKSKGTNDLNKYLGDYSYTDSAICMVYEPVEGEFDDTGNPYYGIQYREIKDLDGLLSSGNVIMMYFSPLWSYKPNFIIIIWEFVIV